jgi:hypothetical protein
MAEEQRVLDLDEVLGQRARVKVRRNGVEYGFVDLYALGAYKVMQLQTMRQKVARFQLMDNISEEQATEAEKLLDDILKMLCADLPLQDCTYMDKTTVLTFYFTEIQQKKVMSPTKQTGAMSSQG